MPSIPKPPILEEAEKPRKKKKPSSRPRPSAAPAPSPAAPAGPVANPVRDELQGILESFHRRMADIVSPARQGASPAQQRKESLTAIKELARSLDQKGRVLPMGRQGKKIVDIAAGLVTKTPTSVTPPGVTAAMTQMGPRDASSLTAYLLQESGAIEIKAEYKPLLKEFLEEGAQRTRQSGVAALAPKTAPAAGALTRAGRFATRHPLITGGVVAPLAITGLRELIDRLIFRPQREREELKALAGMEGQIPPETESSIVENQQITTLLRALSGGGDLGEALLKDPSLPIALQASMSQRARSTPLGSVSLRNPQQSQRGSTSAADLAALLQEQE